MLARSTIALRSSRTIGLRSSRKLAVLLTCCCLGLPAAGCGSSDDEPKGKPLPRAAAGELQKRLDEVERRYEDGVTNFNVGACSDIRDDSFVAIDGILSDLPGDVDPEVRRAVNDSFENLRTLTDDGCAGAEPPPETDTETEPVPPPEETLPEETIPEETVPEETVPEETEPEEEPLPDGGGTVPPGQGGIPPGQGKIKPGNGNDGGAEAPPGFEQD